MTDSRKDHTVIGWYSIGGLALFVIALWYGVTWTVSNKFPKLPDAAGTMGDAFGAVNALFSGLAFTGVVVAILLQMQELRLQRQELEDTRIELEGQKTQLAAQVSRMESDAFDSKFFKLLTQFESSVQSIKGLTGQGYTAIYDFNRCVNGDPIQRAKIEPPLFATVNRSMQLLCCLAEMTADSKATLFHRLVFNASFGQIERQCLLVYLVSKPDATTGFDGIAGLLSDLDFFSCCKMPQEWPDSLLFKSGHKFRFAS